MQETEETKENIDSEEIIEESVNKVNEPDISWKRWVWLLLLVVVVGAIALLLNNTLNKEPTELSVRLGWKHQSQFAGFYVAKEKGYYIENKLSVELLDLNPEKNQVEELVNRDIDVAVMEAHQALEGIANGAPLKVVMAVYQINPHALAVREGSDIYGPEDFSGKVVGLSGGKGEGDVLFDIFINKFGMGEITYVDLGFDTVDDFINQRADIIDVYQVDQPYLAEQKGVPLRIIPLDAYGFTTYGDVVVVHEDLVNTRPEVVRSFVQSSIEGWEFAIKNVDETVEIVLPYTEGSYNDVDYQRHILRKSIPLIKGGRESLGFMEVVAWSTLYEAMRGDGVLEKDFVIKDIYTNEFIN